MEASRARLAASRKICLSTAVITREAHVTINRTLDMLGIGFPPDAADDRQKGARSKVPRADLATAGRLRQRAGDEDDSAVGVG